MTNLYVFLEDNNWDSYIKNPDGNTKYWHNKIVNYKCFGEWS